jgi:hypothetical protein
MSIELRAQSYPVDSTREGAKATIGAQNMEAWENEEVGKP